MQTLMYEKSTRWGGVNILVLLIFIRDQIAQHHHDRKENTASFKLVFLFSFTVCQPTVACCFFSNYALALNGTGAFGYYF
jgi:hypothetical protein